MMYDSLAFGECRQILATISFAGTNLVKDIPPQVRAGHIPPCRHEIPRDARVPREVSLITEHVTLAPVSPPGEGARH